MLRNNHIKNMSNIISNNSIKPIDIKFIVCNLIIILLHLSIATINRSYSHSRTLFYIKDLGITTFFLSGMLSQLQLLAIVYLCAKYGKKGYLAGLIYNLLYFCSNIAFVLITKNTYSILGAIIAFGGAIVITVIYFFCKRLENAGEDFHRLAYTDSLTQLPNRLMFNETLIKYIQVATSDKTNLIVVFIDLDNFKKINDNLGHSKGDLLIQLVAKRMQSILHRKDFLARLSGDEFALLINRQISKEDLAAYLNDFQTIISKDYNLSSIKVSITASFGASIYPEHSTDPDELLMFADTAMYHVKDTGKKGISFFEIGMKNKINRHFEIEKHLPTAWKNGEIFVVYQPQFSATGEKLKGAEALVRWINPNLGFIPPNEFIPIAEHTKLIIPLGEWILKTACCWYIKNASHVGKDFFLSVNVSPVQLLDEDFLNRVKRVLAETGMPPENLQLEITESQYITSLDYVIQTLNTLKSMGISIALDDFGTGYSTFSYIKDLPFDCIKIDKSFIDEIYNEDEAPIIKGVLSLIHNLKMIAIAEGVETSTQQNYLIQEGCNVIQGYLLAQPLKEDAFFENEHVKNAISQYEQLYIPDLEA